MSTTSVWYSQFRHPDLTPPEVSLVGVLSDEFAEGTVVDMTALYPQVRLPTTWIGHGRYQPSTGKLTRLLLRGYGHGDPVPLWFVETPEQTADPPAHTLVAFSGQGVVAGSVLTGDEVIERRIDGGDQVGAVRWWFGSGLVHQIYVQPPYRRKGIGRALILAAAGIRVARGWPRLYGDGQRTDLGEAFVTRGLARWSHRWEPRTSVLPPMTPGEVLDVPPPDAVPDEPG